jgi:hypothetical protein
MRDLAHIIEKNPGQGLRRAGVRGLVGLNDAFIRYFTGHAQAA